MIALRILGVFTLLSLASAASLYVGTGGSDTGNCQSIGSPCASVSYALTQAVDNDDINIAAGTFTENSEVEITQDNLSITGAGSGSTILDFSGAATERRFLVTQAIDVSLSALTIQNGAASTSSGGCLRVEQGDFTINDVTFMGCQAAPQGSGGAILVYGAATRMFISDSHFEQNFAGNGGGIAAVSALQLLDIDTTTFTNNTAGTGGAVFGTGATVTVGDVTVSDHHVSGRGGAFALFSGALTHNTGTLDISGNSAQDTGGAIFCESCDLDSTSGTVWDISSNHAYGQDSSQNVHCTSPGASCVDCDACPTRIGVCGFPSSALPTDEEGCRIAACPQGAGTGQIDDAPLQCAPCPLGSHSDGSNGCTSTCGSTPAFTNPDHCPTYAGLAAARDGAVDDAVSAFNSIAGDLLSSASSADSGASFQSGTLSLRLTRAQENIDFLEDAAPQVTGSTLCVGDFACYCGVGESIVEGECVKIEDVDVVLVEGASSPVFVGALIGVACGLWAVAVVLYVGIRNGFLGTKNAVFVTPSTTPKSAASSPKST